MTTRSRLAALIVAALVVLPGCSVADQIRWAFAERGAPPEVQEQAVRVAWCESTHRPEVTSPSGTYLGLFQMHRRYHAHRPGMETWWLPWSNALAAADLWAEQGWRPWSCRP